MVKDPDHRFIDTHCHLDFIFNRYNIKADFSKFKKSCYQTWSPNFSGCITDFCFPEYYLNDSSKFYEIILSNDDVWAAVGCHPHQAHLYDDVVENYIKQKSSNGKVVAIGELGLDYSSNNKVDPSTQIICLEKQLRLAVKIGKPLVLHCRDAEDDCFDVFKKFVPHDHPIHWHCYSYGSKVAQSWSNYFTRLYFGVTIGVFWAKRKQEFLKKADLKRLLIETDAPYFLPHYYNKEEYGSLNFTHPGMAGLVAVKLAELKSEDVAYISEHILNNTKDFYNIKV